ncbi:MAG: EF-P beta-lysylation protein EpmB [Thiogranum sp.]|nr:EF-P beta-lysylation protein EpmB [Thiogranum sp.]
MIPRSLVPQQPGSWQTQLGRAITDPEQLLSELQLPSSLLPQALLASSRFRLRVPQGFVRRMRKGDPDDPLLRQVLPLGEELTSTEGYGLDPLAEMQSMPVPGLLHKYRGRVLLTLTGACAVHCRYCFRRHYPYNEANPTRDHWESTIAYLAHQRDVNEVILSGGDPLSLSDERLSALIGDLAAISRLQRLRIHSRIPVVLPERVDTSLLEWIDATRLHCVLVVHTNHPNEIDDTVIHAMGRLRAVGVTLLNQSVLLRGINDHADTLVELSQKLFEAGILPYYLHQLDAVQGAAHFAVGDIRAKSLVEEIRDRLPGYLVPRLVREHPHQPSKTPI